MLSGLVVEDLLRGGAAGRHCFAGASGAPDSGRRGAGVLGWPHGGALLSGVSQPLRGGASACGGAAGRGVGGAARLIVRGVQGRGAGALAGLAAGAAVPAAAPDCQQHAVSGFAGLPGSEPGVAGSGPVGEAPVVGHGGAAGASDSPGGDLRGPGPVRGDLPPCLGLEGNQGDAGLRPGRGRLAGARPSEEGSGAPVAPRRGEGAGWAGRAGELGLRGGGAAEGGSASQPVRIPAGGARVPQAPRGASPAGDGPGHRLGGQVGGSSGG